MKELIIPAQPPDPRRRRFGTTWWGAAWLAALEQQAALDPNRLPRGRTYARRGAVGEAVIRPGEALAPVHGSRTAPYLVRVGVTTFNAADWDRVLDAVGRSVGHTAALLDGELPPEVTEDVERTGLRLLPGPNDIAVRCSCPDPAIPCKHAAALCYLLANVLDADPFALLLLRGRHRDDVLAALRARRLAALPATRTAAAGIPASQAYERNRPALPAPLRAPDHPGTAVPLPDHPAAAQPHSAADIADITALAADAARRATRLLSNADTSGLELDETEDLARRSADRLAGNKSVKPGLLDHARAWLFGGRAGLAAFTTTWSPTAPELAPGRAALTVPAASAAADTSATTDNPGPSVLPNAPGTSGATTVSGGAVRVWRNRLTRGDRQLRLGRDGRWYPYRARRVNRWSPDGEPSTDPADLLDDQHSP